MKWMGIVPILALYGLNSAVLCALPVRRDAKRTIAAASASFFARIILWLLNIRVQTKHHERLRSNGCARLIIANHVSYIDVLALASLAPCVFITSVELKNTALLGTLARLSGSIFVERRKPSGLKREIQEIAQVLGQGTPVVLFPEGTTSNGDRVQPFKNSLFDAAIAAQAEIMPVCLHYTRINGQRLTAHNRDQVFYYGGIAFLKHFARLLTLKSVDVEVNPLRPIRVSARHSRKELAATTHQAISAALKG
jgi:1-acyl-sn-glycerol-3-phosphate acyltransferase